MIRQTGEVCRSLAVADLGSRLMPIGRKRIGASIAAILLAVGLSAYGHAPCADRPASIEAIEAGPTITIRVPASVAAGGTLCFEVLCYAGVGSVSVEINDVILPVTQNTSTEPGVAIFCVRIPAGCSGSIVTITAVSPTGLVATASVPVT